MFLYDNNNSNELYFIAPFTQSAYQILNRKEQTTETTVRISKYNILCEILI